MSKKKTTENEDKKILTISLPAELYQLLLKKSGKGNVGNYVREALEAKLKEEEILLTRAYRKLEESSEYQNIAIFSQETSIETLKTKTPKAKKL